MIFFCFVFQCEVEKREKKSEINSRGNSSEFALKVEVKKKLLFLLKNIKIDQIESATY